MTSKTLRAVTFSALLCAVIPVGAAAQEPPRPGSTQTPLSDAARRFDDVLIGHAVKDEIRLQEAKRGHLVATTSGKTRSLGECMLIGAGIGAGTGGVWAATDGRCTVDTLDLDRRCTAGGSTTHGSAVAVGVLGGALVGAGVGAIVKLLIR